MTKKELIEISDRMFETITHYVIQHDFKIEVYNITNDKLYKRLVMNGESLVNMYNFIDYLVRKLITQIIIKGVDKTIKVFVKDKKELLE